MDDLLRAIGNFGFPMVVSAYLLVRLEAKLDRVASSITELAVAVRALRNHSEVLHHEGEYSD